MKRVKVDSDNVEDIGIDTKNHILEVGYKKSGVYQYENVSTRTFTNLLKTDSVGSYLHRNVIGKYKEKKIG